MNHAALPPFGWDSFVHQWSFSFGWTVVTALLVVGYLDAVIRARAYGRPQVPWWRVLCFLAGAALLLLTVSSAIDVYAMSIFWVHMVEHLLLIMVVPALLVLGHPLACARNAMTPAGQARFDRVLHAGPVAVVTHPAFGFVLYAVVIVGTHLTTFMDAMTRHPWLMPAEQVAFVVSGYLLLLTMIGREPVRWEIPYLARVMLVLVAMVPDTIVGIVLLQSDHLLYPRMFGLHPSWAPEALFDQQIAGGLMWAAGDGLMMVIGVVVVVTMLADPERRRVLGPWLESARRQTLVDHLGHGTDEEVVLDSDADIDEGDQALDAYNAMLGRLGRADP